jgi:hypothetical protein
MLKCTTGEIRICDEHMSVGIVVLENWFCTFFNENFFCEVCTFTKLEKVPTSKVQY